MRQQLAPDCASLLYQLLQCMQLLRIEMLALYAILSILYISNVTLLQLVLCQLRKLAYSLPKKVRTGTPSRCGLSSLRKCLLLPV